jgi:gluconate kinase
MGVLSFYLSSFLTPFLLFFKIFGINYYIIRKDDEKTRAIAKILQNTSINSITLFQCGNFHPDGFFINFDCAGYYNYVNLYDGISAEIYILTTASYLKKLIENEKPSISFTDNSTSSKPLLTTKTTTIYLRAGAYTNIYYTRLRVYINDLEPMGQQGDIVDSICKRFTEKRRGVFFIYGVSGAGKSTVGILVANKLNGTFCHTFNPTDPGDTLQHILRDSDPMDDRPTIIVLEEVNTLIHAVDEGSIQQHKNITTCIRNKITYNTFIDDLKLYKNVLFIMTSNETKESIDSLDPCYLRKGRVYEYYSMMETLTI